MRENLYYLFVSGLILGSGPCLGFCAPIIAGFIAVYRPSLGKALSFYAAFSFFKILSYIILGILCGIFSGILKSGFFLDYGVAINIALGAFVLLIGILTLAVKEPLGNKYCAFLRRGNVKNAGLLGFLIGFSPCLPLLGILNYIVIVSHNLFEAGILAFSFGLGTAISPVIFLAGIFGGVAGKISQNKALQVILKFICGLLFLFLGLRIILQRLPR